MSEIGIDPPVAMFVGVCQRVARNLSPEAHMIELGLLSTKTSFDIAKTFAIGELSKGQTKELIPAGEIFDVTTALVPLDANLKLLGWQELHELRENGAALVDLLPPEQAGSSRMAPKQRQKIEIEKTHRDPLLSFNQAVTADYLTFLGRGFLQARPLPCNGYPPIAVISSPPDLPIAGRLSQA